MTTQEGALSGSPPLISVVIPAYNAGEFLSRTLESARQQTHANLEILVVDDGSTDNTAAIVAKQAAEDARVRLVRTQNQGVALARNKGIEESRGDYVAFLDADDLWHPRKLQLQLAVFAEQPQLGAVWCLSRQIDVSDRAFGGNEWVRADGWVLLRHLTMNFVGSGSVLLCPRSVAVAVGGFDGRFGNCADFDFQLKVASLHPFGFVPLWLVGYRRHDRSMSRSSRQMAQSTLDVVRRNLDANPSVSARCRRWALGASRFRAIVYSVRAGRYGAACGWTAMMALADPVSLLREATLTLPRLLVSSLRARFDRNGVLSPPNFYDLEAAMPAGREVGGLYRRRLELLAQDEANMRRSSPLEWSQDGVQSSPATKRSSERIR